MKYRVEHQTTYVNARPVSVGHNEARLTPRVTARQAVLSHAIQIEPPPSGCTTLTDYFGNTVTQFIFNQGYSTLSISAVNEVSLVAPQDASDPGPNWESLRSELAEHASAESLDAYEFCFESPRCRVAAEFAEYGKASLEPARPLRLVLVDLLDRIHRDFRYDAQATTVTTPVEQVFRQRRGVCQDFAHLMISVLRSCGLAARYVSGYLRTISAPGKPRLVGADASHAWLSVYAGRLGWIDVDPTNRQFTALDHITLAWGRDYTDVAPVKGVYIGGSSPQLQVSVDVRPVEERS
ncbi:MAG: transglutaminase family protein [Planctomycetes bacterium]|nr:transglutaminase family protein [Planctomycetota bacterium]